MSCGATVLDFAGLRQLRARSALMDGRAYCTLQMQGKCASAHFVCLQQLVLNIVTYKNAIFAPYVFSLVLPKERERSLRS